MCSLCNKGYFYDEINKKCLQFSPNNKQGIVMNNTVPFKCPSGCLQCDNKLSCSVCLSGFSLLKNICVQCVNDCETCYSNAPNKCLSCRKGFILINGSCKMCEDSFCLDCPAFSGVCIQCKDGYYLKETRCLKCS